MSFLQRLFGKKQEVKKSVVRALTDRSVTQSDSADSKLIVVYDAYGRELRIPKQEWRDKVLLGTLENAKNDPDKLFSLLSSALSDGFAADVVSYAELLHRTDPNPARGAVLLGVVYLQLDRLSEAEQTLSQYIQHHGEEGYALTNLAKVFDRRGEHSRAEKTLWRAIELDPNQENAVGWFWAMTKERNGDDAGIATLQRISRLPESWLAHLQLALIALDRNETDRALCYYAEALAKASRPIPTYLLLSLSGELGKRGQLVELLKLSLPYFDATVHGLEVGNNLIKANLDLGRLDHARAILEQLYALKRPDYQQALSFWDTEIAQAKVASDNAIPVPRPLSVGIMAFFAPIWLPSGSPAAAHFHPAKAHDAVSVCFIGSSVQTVGLDAPQARLPDMAGRLSRSLPMFLAEQIHFRSDASAVILQPWLIGKGFAVMGGPWDPEGVIEQAKRCEPPSDYAVVTHLIDSANPHLIQYHVIRCIDKSVLSAGEVPFTVQQLAPAFLSLADKVLSALCRFAEVDPMRPSSNYELPSGQAFDYYQLRLEQLLAVRAEASDDTREHWLSGDRDILLGNIHQCLEQSKNPTTRLILVETLTRLKKLHPQVVAEFADQLQQLQRDFPLKEPIHGIIQNLLNQAIDP